MAQKIHTTTTGDVSGNTLGYTFDFPSLAQDDIRVSVAGVLKTLTSDYTIGQWSATGSTSNYIQFVNSTKRGTGTVRIFRETPKTGPKASFTSGSAIKADDLNNNQKQSIYIAEEFEDDMTNLAANDTSGFSINGSNIADNSITTTKISGLEVKESDIDNDAVTANKLKSSTSTDSVRAVTTNHIRDGAVTDAKIAGVAGSKVTPNFGSQNIVTTGSLNSGDLTISHSHPQIYLTDIDNDSDFKIQNYNGVFGVRDQTNSATRFSIDSSGTVDVAGNLDVGAGIDVTGTCTATTFSGSGASLTNLPSSALSGALPAISGANLTNLPTAGANKPAWYGIKTTNNYIAEDTLSTITQLTDQGSYAENGFNASSGVFTVPSGKGGFYFVTAGVTFDNLSSAESFYIQFKKNGSAINPKQYNEHISYSDDENLNTVSANITSFIALANGDTIEAAVFRTMRSISNAYLLAGTYFGGFKLNV